MRLPALGELRGRAVVALEHGVAEVEELLAVGERGGGRSAVAADDGDDVAGNGGDEEDFAGAVGADLVADTEARAVGDGDRGGVVGVGRKDGLVDRVGVREERVLDPLVDGAQGGPLGVAEHVQERGLERADHADDVGDVVDEFGEVGSGLERGFAGEGHGELQRKVQSEKGKGKKRRDEAAGGEAEGEVGKTNQVVARRLRRR